jgi:hypothetical protein
MGGWGPWERWRLGRRLVRHARREGGAPPPELLQRLRDDLPGRPAAAPAPGAGMRERRLDRGARRRLLVAASLAAAVSATVVGLRVLVRHDLPGSWSGAEYRLSGPAATGRRGLRAEKLLAPPSPPAAATPRELAAPAAPQPQPATPPPPQERARPAGALAARPKAAPRPVTAPADGAVAGGAGAAPAPPAASAAGPPAEQSAPAARPAPPERALAEAPLSAAAAGGVEERPAAEPGTSVAPSSPALGKAMRQRAAAATPAPLRSSFGGDAGETGTAFYRRLRHELAEGRLPPAAAVRAGELANAFELAREAEVAVSRPLLAAEGAPVPPPGAAWLVRFTARGLAGPPGAETVEVFFDPTLVTSARRIGATVYRGGASALYEIELRRKAVGASVIATLRLVRVEEGAPEAAATALLARQVHLSELHPTWAAASAELRLPGLAVLLADALAASDPAPRLRELRVQARALAAELPGEPRAAELLELVDRAADLAAASATRAPQPPPP